MKIGDGITLIAAILGATGLGNLLATVFISRKSRVTKRVECIERDCNRTQLLLLMNLYPSSHEEILKVAQEYFITLRGNWYMDSLFLEWLKHEGLERPSWYIEKRDN